MANLTNVIDNYFAVASETYESNLSATIAAGAAIVPVNTTSAYTNGDVAVLTVDPGTVNEATFIGVKNGNQFEKCVWTEGNTGVGHTAGATIIDYDSATHFSAMSKGIRQFANNDGTLKTQPVRDALALGATATSGWEVLPNTLSVSTGYNKGNREYDITVAGANLSSTISAGMKLRMQRATAAPTQSVDLEAASTQYASRASGSLTGITFTDDFTAEAWVKLESYVGTSILSRSDGTNGWNFSINGDGSVRIVGYNGGVGNQRRVDTYQSLPLNRWVHIAASLDMSGSVGTVYIDGVSVPVVFGVAGTSPAALVQAGNLQIGAFNATLPFDGKIADVRLWNTVRSQLQIRDNMNQQLVGTETNLVGYWKLNGNFNDSTANVNHLTGSGGAVATDADNPMKDTEYAIVTKVSYSAPNTTLTVFTGTDHNIPNMTLTAPYYSTQRTPYGFPASKEKWNLQVLLKSTITLGTTSSVWYGGTAVTLNLPTGSWDVRYRVRHLGTNNSNTYRIMQSTLSTSSTAETDENWTSIISVGVLGASTVISHFRAPHEARGFLAPTSQTPYYLLVLDEQPLTAHNLERVYIDAECAYV